LAPSGASNEGVLEALRELKQCWKVSIDTRSNFH